MNQEKHTLRSIPQIDLFVPAIPKQMVETAHKIETNGILPPPNKRNRSKISFLYDEKCFETKISKPKPARQVARYSLFFFF